MLTVRIYLFSLILLLSAIISPSHEIKAPANAQLIKQTLALEEDTNKEITALTSSADNNYIAAGISDGSIYVLHLPSMKSTKVAQLDGHITCFAFSPDHAYLAAGSFNNKLTVLHVATGHMLITSRDHASSLITVGFSDQNNLISISQTELIYWNYNGLTNNKNTPLHITGLPTELQSIIQSYLTNWAQEPPVRWKKKIKIATLLAGHKQVFCSTFSSQDYIYNLEAKNFIAQKSHESTSSLAASSGFIAIGSNTGKIIVSRIGSGTEDTITDGRTSPYAISTLTFNPDGQLLISGANRKVSVWDIKNRKRIKLIHEPNKNFIVSTTYSPDGTFMAIGNSQAEVHIVPLVSQS